MRFVRQAQSYHAVSPSSLAGMSCNSSVTFTYAVTFHGVPNSPGGTIQFMDTTNNGRSSTKGSVTASAGTTTVTYTFTSSGVPRNRGSDNDQPQPGELATGKACWTMQLNSW